MSDSFADLWNTKVPEKPSQKLGTPPIASQTSRRHPQQDAFSLLSSAASTPNSRPITPATKQTLKPAPSGDAFGDLFSSTSGNNGGNLTMAERAAKADRERREALLRNQEAVRKQAAAWSGLDSLGNQPKLITSIQEPARDDVWDFGLSDNSKGGPSSSNSIPTSKPTQIVSSSTDEYDWGIGDFSSQSSSEDMTKPHPPAPILQGSVWDLDAFTSGPAAVHGSSRRNESPGDFDFGDREDRLLDGDSGEDDILGSLSKPVDSMSKARTVRSEHNTSAQRLPTTRSDSPPPHIIGQIVEMGFSPQQARIALAATDTGLDVPAALEMLLSNNADSGTPAPSHERQQNSRQPRRTAAPRSGSQPNRNEETPSPGSNQQQSSQMQEQADKLLAQASVIGISMFNKANAFWTQGKEKVQKAYEERSAAGSSDAVRDGRPRWMQEQDATTKWPEEDHRRKEPWVEDDSFGDGDNNVLPPKPVQQNKTQTKEAAYAPKSGTVDLSSDDAPAFYVSPFRKGKPKGSSRAKPEVTPSTPPLRVPSPIQRQAPSASLSVIAASEKQKLSGTAAFKLGQFAEAERCYGAALDLLPPSHLLRVPLLNNRAVSRLKIGEHSGTVEDCDAVIEIVGARFHPSQERGVQEVERGAGVNLADALVKALKRRAEANESQEKWERARQDWETLVGTGWTTSQNRAEAVRGAGRCRRMLAGPSVPQPPAKKAAIRRPPPRTLKTPPSQALNAVKKAHSAAEAEDVAKHDLKDTVDARLLAWKGGKESNIRALLASLDTVLWPELGWVKIGMAELVGAGQVKVRYMKAIAKLHPDKLSSINITLEQRMIANGVFGALNEAWNTFKQ